MIEMVGKRHGVPCATDGCARVVMSKKGRPTCRECWRKTVVWKNPSNQRNNQCVGFAEPLESCPPRTKQMDDKEGGAHLMSLLRGVGVLDFSPVKLYFKCAVETAELFRRYAA